MQKYIIISYVSDILTLLLVSSIAVFLQERYNLANLYKVLSQRPRRELDIEENDSSAIVRFTALLSSITNDSKTFWLLIRTKKIMLEVVKVFSFLLFVISVVKYSQYF